MSEPVTYPEAMAHPLARDLYTAVNLMMATLGRDGEIDTRNPLTENVLNALYDIDGGVYIEEPK